MENGRSEEKSFPDALNPFQPKFYLFFFLLLPFYLMILKGEFHNDNNFVHDLWMNKFYGPETSQAISPVQK